MRRSLVAGFVLSMLLLAGSARADTVNITFVDNPFGMIGPYIGSVDGKLSDIICDDYISETYPDESWTANVSTLDDLSGTKFHDLTGYEEVAWLASKLLDGTNGNSAAAIQFAIWQVFEAPTPFNDLSGSLLTDAQSWLSDAGDYVHAADFNPAVFTNFRIYTAVGDPTCSGGPCPPGPTTPQEFVTFVPEPGSLQLLSIGLLMAFGFWRYRKSAAGVPQVQSV